MPKRNGLVDFFDRHILKVGLVLLLAVSIFIRFKLLPFYTNDMNVFLLPWVDVFRQQGLAALGEGVGNYNILYMLVLYAISLFTNDADSTMVAIKAVSIVFDYLMAAGLGMIVYELSANRRQAVRFRWTCFAFAIGTLLPMVMLNSALWGQCDSIFGCFSVWAVYMLLRNRNLAAFVMLGLAFCFKLQAIFLLPLFVILYFVQRKFSVFMFLIPPAMLFVASLPAVFMGANLFTAFEIYFVDQVTDYEYIYVNYPSFAALIQDERYEYFATGLTLLALLVCFTMLAVLMRRKLRIDSYDILTLSIWSIYACVLFLPSMHERYAYVGEVLVWAAFLVHPGRRTLIPAIVYTFAGYCAYSGFLFHFQPVPSQYLALVCLATFGYLTYNFVSDISDSGARGFEMFNLFAPAPALGGYSAEEDAYGEYGDEEFEEEYDDDEYDGVWDELDWDDDEDDEDWDIEEDGSPESAPEAQPAAVKAEPQTPVPEPLQQAAKAPVIDMAKADATLKPGAPAPRPDAEKKESAPAPEAQKPLFAETVTPVQQFDRSTDTLNRDDAIPVMFKPAPAGQDKPAQPAAGAADAAGQAAAKPLATPAEPEKAAAAAGASETKVAAAPEETPEAAPHEKPAAEAPAPTEPKEEPKVPPKPVDQSAYPPKPGQKVPPVVARPAASLTSSVPVEGAEKSTREPGPHKPQETKEQETKAAEAPGPKAGTKSLDAVRKPEEPKAEKPLDKPVEVKPAVPAAKKEPAAEKPDAKDKKSSPEPIKVVTRPLQSLAETGPKPAVVSPAKPADTTKEAEDKKEPEKQPEQAARPEKPGGKAAAPADEKSAPAKEELKGKEEAKEKAAPVSAVKPRALQQPVRPAPAAKPVQPSPDAKAEAREKPAPVPEESKKAEKPEETAKPVESRVDAKPVVPHPLRPETKARAANAARAVAPPAGAKPVAEGGAKPISSATPEERARAANAARAASTLRPEKAAGAGIAKPLTSLQPEKIVPAQVAADASLPFKLDGVALIENDDTAAGKINVRPAAPAPGGARPLASAKPGEAAPATVEAKPIAAVASRQPGAAEADKAFEKAEDTLAQSFGSTVRGNAEKSPAPPQKPAPARPVFELEEMLPLESPRPGAGVSKPAAPEITSAEARPEPAAKAEPTAEKSVGTVQATVAGADTAPVYARSQLDSALPEATPEPAAQAPQVAAPAAATPPQAHGQQVEGPAGTPASQEPEGPAAEEAVPAAPAAGVSPKPVSEATPIAEIQPEVDSQLQSADASQQGAYEDPQQAMTPEEYAQAYANYYAQMAVQAQAYAEAYALYYAQGYAADPEAYNEAYVAYYTQAYQEYYAQQGLQAPGYTNPF